MRTMLKVTMPVETGNKAIKDGSLPKALETISDQLRPEASYFYADGGERAALFVFEMKEASQIPVIAEPLFMTLNAKVQFFPVMNQADLKAGLERAAKELGRVPVAA